MAQDAFDLMAESNLEGRDWRVFAKLLGRIDFENLMVVNQAELAKRAGNAQAARPAQHQAPNCPGRDTGRPEDRH